ncbi:MAG: hypothetical protein KC506_01375 [Nanoarchaeota archaeon]|nr:hypothetical protein [Nanoarchaeota archaeon]
MKKGVIFGVFSLLVFTFLLINVHAAAEDSDNINKAMVCLDGLVEQNTISLEEAIFAGLANTPNDKIEEKIDSEKSESEECWPREGCNVKTTAQVAIKKIDDSENVTGIIEWLKSQSGVSDDLTWYLQIISDNNGAATCTVNYKGNDNNVNIEEDMKLSGNPGSCLSFDNSKNKLEIQSSCLTEEFSVTCNESFKTNLLYTKTGEDTLFVSDITHSGSGEGSWTYESVSAKCFQKGGQCDYEGTLWASTVLYAALEDTSDYAPYLRALARDNLKYLPYAFLQAILEADTNNYNDLVEGVRTRPEGGYWEAPSSAYNRYYDTALAMMAFGGEDSAEIRNANTINFLFENQGENGCWNNENLRDTAFIIYAAGWYRDDDSSSGSDDSGATPPNPGTIIPNSCNNGFWGIDENNSIDGRTERGYCHLDEGGCCPSGYTCEFQEGNESESICVSTGGNGPYNPSLVTDCEVAGYDCGSVDECYSSGGEPFPQSTHACLNPLLFCCSVNIIESNCEIDLGGQICGLSESCTGSWADSAGGSCCVGGVCEAEEECSSDIDCSIGQICSGGECVSGDTDECFVDSDCLGGENCVDGSCVKERGSFWIWVIILLILIALVILGIVYRDKIKVWWFKFRNRKTDKKRENVGPPGSGMFGRRPTPRFMPRGFGPGQGQMPVRRPVQAKPNTVPEEKENSGDKDRDETFKKLREMSK